MESRKHVPGAPLSRYVHCFWYWQGAPGPHCKERLLPNGEFSLVFNLRDEPIRIYDARDLSRYAEYGPAVVSAARADCFVIDCQQQECVAGVQFRAGAATALLGVHGIESEGRSIGLADLWPGRAREVREQLLHAPDASALFQVLERVLLERLRRVPETHPAVSYAVRRFQSAPGAERVGRVIDEIGLS